MIRRLVWLAVLGAGVYIAYHYAVPQIRAWRFHDAMTQAVRLGQVNPVAETRATLLATADSLGVPLTPRDLRIHKGRRGVVVSASWDEVVTIDGGRLGRWVDTLYYAYEVGPEDAR